MNKHYLLLALLFSIGMRSQSDKITFAYDPAGNQTNRVLCLTCAERLFEETKNEISKVGEEVKEEELEKFFENDVISYYPNPVQEELFLKWELIANKTVTNIQLFDLNGRALKSYDNLQSSNTLNIPFINYPKGTYLVVLFYNDGEQKSIKILK